MMQVALLAPIASSLYSRTVAARLVAEPGITLAGIVVRTPWSLERIRGELRRDGARLLEKVAGKWLLGEGSYHRTAGDGSTGREGQPVDQLAQIARRQDCQVVTVKDHNAPKALAFLRGLNLDMIVFTGGGLIRKELLAIPRLGVLNCHSGILPHYRGMDVVEWAILEAGRQAAEVGLTVHWMDQGVDTGPILLPNRVDIQPGETIADLRRRMEPLMVEMVLAAVRAVRAGALNPQPQRAEDGRQYFVMHPRLKACAEKRLAVQ